MEGVIEKMSILKYSSYKNSGVEWLGDIPEHWETLNGKYIFRIINERSVKGDEELLSVSEHHGVRPRSSMKVNTFMAESYEGYKLCYPGDLVINSLWAWSKGLGVSNDKGIVSTAYSVYRPDPTRYNKSYLHYLLRIENYVAQYLIASRGIWISRLLLSDWSFLRIPILTPPLKEQIAIAKFLDSKTALIDQAINIKENQIELLKERRQILIHKIVTRGLNANVKMKESGVGWIGEIPEHWEVIRLKYILKERNERSILGNEPLLMMSQVHGLVIRADFHDKAEVAKSTEGNKIVLKNDLVFNKLKAHLGVFFKSTIDFPGIVSPDYAVYYSNGVIADLKYLELIFRTPEYLREFVCRITGIVEGLMRLYTKDLFEIPMLVPPDKEQKQILDLIEAASLKIGTATSLKEKEIEKLKEYKATLINSAVTGKIKVTGCEGAEIHSGKQ